MELLRLLLLDDECILLEGLRDTYDWEEMGYQIVGAYLDAEDAMAELSVTQPQVILTDIRMRNMDGLEFFRQVKEELPDCLGIFVSAYRDFDYAKKACELGAFGYLPKPFKDEDITDIMRRAHEAYLQKKEQMKGYLAAKYLASQQNAGFINVLVEKYAKEQLDDEGMERLLSVVTGKTPVDQRFTCLIADVDIEYALRNGMEYEAMRYEMFEILEKEIKQFYQAWTFSQENGSKAFLVDTSGLEGKPTLQELVVRAKSQREIELISVVSKEYPGMPGIQASYQQARHLYEIMLGFGDNMPSDHEDKMLVDMGSINNMELAIIDSIRRNDSDGLKKVYRDFVGELPVEDSEAMTYLLQLAIRVQLYLRSTYGATEKLDDYFRGFYRQLFSLSKLSGSDYLYNMIAQAIKSRIEYCRDKSADNFSSYIQQAIDYIETHYGEESLTINDVAAAVYLNPVYFGRMFKQSTGTPFRRYLMNVRMEKAKQLLIQGKYGVVQIGEMVGIENPSYFTQLFKKYTGKVPSEFAEGNY